VPMKSPAWVAVLVSVVTAKHATPLALPDFEEVSLIQTTFQDGGASSPFRYFCKRSAHENTYHENCSTCVGGPICCDKTKAKHGPGGAFCNFGQAVSVGRCAVSPHPPACLTISRGCKAVKHHLETPFFYGSGGRVFPYWSLGSPEGLYDNDSNVTHAIVVFHGYHGNSGDQKACYVEDAVRAQLRPEHHRRVLILAPQFYYPTDNHTSKELAWTRGGWLQGRQSYNGLRNLSSFSVIDELLKELTLKGTFPNLRTVRLVGFSAGGQFVQKYAAFGQAYEQITGALGASISIEFVVASPNTLTYFDSRRPVLDIIEVCEQGGYCNTAIVHGTKFEFRMPVASPCNKTSNNYKYGLGGNLVPYVRTIDLSAAIKSFGKKKVTYLVGNRDTCNNRATALPCQMRCRGTGCDGSCEANLQGFCRHMRLHAWFQYVDGLYEGQHRHAIHDVPVGHDSYQLWTNEATAPHVVGTNAEFDALGP